MRRCVWSFWSKPFQVHRRSAWTSEEQHLFSWVLSVETARKKYPETSLVTDDEGATMLLDELGLEFDHVSTELNALKEHDPGWWALGKLYAYRAQKEPFIHLDNDVFLWKPLSPVVETGAVFAQNPEYFSSEASCYKPEVFEDVLKVQTDSWLPEEWQWYRSSGLPQRGECCGIFGGTRVDFINYYAETAINLIENPNNQRGWSLLPEKICHNILFEQYLLSACIEYHRNNPASPFLDIDIQYIFQTWEDAYAIATSIGYTHLLGDAKKNNLIAERMANRIRNDYPEYYYRVQSMDTQKESKNVKFQKLSQIN